MAEEGHLLLEELALARVGVVALLLQPSQHELHQLSVLLCCAGVDEDVIDEHHHAFVQPVTQDALHLPLESGRRVADTEGHVSRLLQSQRRGEGQQLLRLLVHRDLPEALEQVELGEDAAALQVVEHHLRQRQRVGVRHSQLVHAPVVPARPLLVQHDAVALLGHQHRLS